MDLRATLQKLAFAKRGFDDTAARQARGFSQIDFPKLSEAIERIDSVAKPIEPADLHLQEWLSYSTGKTKSLSSRIIRNLSWHPEVALQSRFWDLIEGQSRSKQSAITIQGLVYSSHYKWQEALNLQQLTGVRKIVELYTGSNSLVNKWRNNSHFILFANSAERLAQMLYKKQMPLTYAIKEYGLFEDTTFFREVVSTCANHCTDELSTIEILNYFIHLLAWDKHEIETYKKHINSSLNSKAFDESENIKKQLVDYVVNDAERLGDPRLRPVRWIGIEKSRDKVLQYLSKEDITFFFKKLMTYDAHGRANFWLKYVPSMTRSRPLLTDVDRSRLSYILNRGGNTTRHFGRTKGQHSAFLLDFGNVLAVEFEGMGACYLYDAKTRERYFGDFFTDVPYSDQKLKMQNESLYRKSHQGNWEWALAQALAQSGIRPSL